MGRSKVGKLMGWNKDSLISQGEGKRNLWWQSWPHTSRPMPCYSWVVATLEDNLLRFTVLQLCYWVWHYMMWKVPLASLRSVVSTLCPAASLPAGMGHSGTRKALMAVQLLLSMGEDKVLMLCKHYLAISKTLGCYQNCFRTEIQNAVSYRPL